MVYHSLGVLSIHLPPKWNKVVLAIGWVPWLPIPQITFPKNTYFHTSAVRCKKGWCHKQHLFKMLKAEFQNKLFWEKRVMDERGREYRCWERGDAVICNWLLIWGNYAYKIAEETSDSSVFSEGVRKHSHHALLLHSFISRVEQEGHKNL